MKRLESLDTLRGITIIGMILVNNPGSWSHVYTPLLHAKWHGLTPTDLIFPFFLLIVGTSISISYRNKVTNRDVYEKILFRSFKLIGLGLLINIASPNFPFIETVNQIRIPGVLQRIGIVFLCSSLIFLKYDAKKIITIITFILLSYYLFLNFVPLPNGTSPTFDESSNNWVNYIDQIILGSHMWKPSSDPEGLLSTIPAIATCLLGIVIGKIMLSKSNNENKLKKLLYFVFLLLSSGYLWGYLFPINKSIWSSSYVLVAAGWGTLILAIAYYINDLKKISSPKLITYVSQNAIVIYFLSMIISKFFYLIKINDKQNVHSWIFDTIFIFIKDLKLASFSYALCVMFFYLLLAYYLNKKKIFIKV